VSFPYLLECSVQIYLPCTRYEGKGASLTHPVRATEWVSALWLRNPSRVLVALRLLAAVAAMKRKREYTERRRKTISVRKKFWLWKRQEHRLTGPFEKLCLRRTRADIMITMFECANPYAILGLTSNVLRDM
jgi:hypothetical protein